MYENGSGVRQDHTEALEWHRKAADQGYSDAKLAVDRVQKID
jgi:TPR repeat protein